MCYTDSYSGEVITLTELEKARSFFANDLYATKATGIVIEEVGECYAKCSMKIERYHLNAVGHVMGGVMFTLADFVFAICTNRNGQMTVTTSSTINYLSSPKGEMLYGESKLLKDGKTTCFYQIDVTDELGNKIAVINTTGNHIHKK